MAWLPVVGWEGIYEVSDQGELRSCTRETNGPNGERRFLRSQPKRIHFDKDGMPGPVSAALVTPKLRRCMFWSAKPRTPSEPGIGGLPRERHSRRQPRRESSPGVV